MRSDVLNSSSNSYGQVPSYLKTTAKTADFAAASGHVYVVTKLDGCAVTLPVPKVGDVIKVIFDGATSNSHTITSDASTTLFGILIL